MKNISFSFQFQQFFRSILRQRNYIIKTNRSLKDKTEMLAAIDKLQPYYYMNFTDLGAAKFLDFHYYTIKKLIPSKNNKNFNNLNSLYKTCLDIKRKQLIYKPESWPSCTDVSAFF